MQRSTTLFILATLLSGCGSDSDSSSDSGIPTLRDNDTVVRGTLAQAHTIADALRFYYLPEPDQAALAIINTNIATLGDQQIEVRTYQGDAPIALSVQALKYASEPVEKWDTGVERRLQWVYLSANSATEMALDIRTSSGKQSLPFAFALLEPQRSALNLIDGESLVHGTRTVTQRCNGGFTGDALPATTYDYSWQFIANFAAGYLEDATGNRIPLQTQTDNRFGATQSVVDFSERPEIPISYHYDPAQGTVTAEGESSAFDIDDGQASCVIDYHYHGQIVL